MYRKSSTNLQIYIICFCILPLSDFTVVHLKKIHIPDTVSSHLHNIAPESHSPNSYVMVGALSLSSLSTTIAKPHVNPITQPLRQMHLAPQYTFIAVLCITTRLTYSFNSENLAEMRQQLQVFAI